MVYAIEKLVKVARCAVDGYAVGGGLETTLAADFAVATQEARLRVPEVD